MTQLLGRFSEHSYALLRIVAGYLFLLHGAQKLLGVPGGDDPVALLSLFGLAGIIELCGGTLITLGLFGRYAALIASGEMAFAYFRVHAAQGSALFPLLNGGDRTVLFCFLFLYLAARGSGTWSLDRVIWGKK